TLKAAGLQSITGTDVVTPSITSAQNGISVVAGNAASFNLTANTTNQTAGNPFTFTATAIDAFGNLATNYGGQVTFTTAALSLSAVKSLPVNYTFTAGDAGVHQFVATLVTAGTQTIRVADINFGSSGTKAFVISTNGIVKNFLVSGFPSPSVAG